MIKISKRAALTPSSPIRKLSLFAEKIRKKGIHVYNLNIGQSDLITPGIFFDTIKSYSKKTLTYAPSTGYESVKSAWHEYFKQHDIAYNKEEIIVTTGASEAIIFSLIATCDPHDEIIVFEPIYPNYITFAKMVSVKLSPVTTHVDTIFHIPIKQKIIKKITSKTKAILICNPNNPSGAVYTKKELRTIVDIALKYKLFIISDETYREFIYDDKKCYSMAHFAQVENHVILIDSISKRFNVCGARIGCLASKNKKIIDSITRFSQGRLSSPTLEQLASIPLLKNSRKFVKPILREYEKRRSVIMNALSSISGSSMYKPEGTFYYMIKLPIRNTEKFCEWLVKKYNFKKKTLMLAPGQGFYITRGLGKNEVRIAYVLNEKKLKDAMQILKNSIKIYQENVSL